MVQNQHDIRRLGDVHLRGRAGGKALQRDDIFVILCLVHKLIRDHTGHIHLGNGESLNKGLAVINGGSRCIGGNVIAALEALFGLDGDLNNDLIALSCAILHTHMVGGIIEAGHIDRDLLVRNRQGGCNTAQNGSFARTCSSFRKSDRITKDMLAQNRLADVGRNGNGDVRRRACPQVEVFAHHILQDSILAQRHIGRKLGLHDRAEGNGNASLCRSLGIIRLRGFLRTGKAQNALGQNCIVSGWGRHCMRTLRILIFRGNVFQESFTADALGGSATLELHAIGTGRLSSQTGGADGIDLRIGLLQCIGHVYGILYTGQARVVGLLNASISGFAVLTVGVQRNCGNAIGEENYDLIPFCDGISRKDLLRHIQTGCRAGLLEVGADGIDGIDDAGTVPDRNQSIGILIITNHLIIFQGSIRLHRGEVLACLESLAIGYDSRTSRIGLVGIQVDQLRPIRQVLRPCNTLQFSRQNVAHGIIHIRGNIQHQAMGVSIGGVAHIAVIGIVQVILSVDIQTGTVIILNSVIVGAGEAGDRNAVIHTGGSQLVDEVGDRLIQCGILAFVVVEICDDRTCHATAYQRRTILTTAGRCIIINIVFILRCRYRCGCIRDTDIDPADTVHILDDEPVVDAQSLAGFPITIVIVAPLCDCTVCRLGLRHIITQLGAFCSVQCVCFNLANAVDAVDRSRIIPTGVSVGGSALGSIHRSRLVQNQNDIRRSGGNGRAAGAGGKSLQRQEEFIIGVLDRRSSLVHIQAAEGILLQRILCVIVEIKGRRTGTDASIHIVTHSRHRIRSQPVLGNINHKTIFRGCLQLLGREIQNLGTVQHSADHIFSAIHTLLGRNTALIVNDNGSVIIHVGAGSAISLSSGGGVAD